MISSVLADKYRYLPHNGCSPHFFQSGVNKVNLDRVINRVLRFPAVRIIPAMLHTFPYCPYHSSNAPHISLLSVSFQQCSTHFPTVRIIPAMLHTFPCCPYHSSNAPHISLLSISLQQCSTHFPTDASHSQHRPVKKQNQTINTIHYYYY